MSGPESAVRAGQDPFSGGTLARNSIPTAIGTSLFSSPGVGGFPKPGVPGILSARNNSGSNSLRRCVGLVPLRKREQNATANEYDGLESGELGWILGRQFYGTESTNGLQLIQSSAHGYGIGKGVDRMQRLASTNWMESHFKSTFGAKVIQLHNIKLYADSNLDLVRELKYYNNNMQKAVDATLPAPGSYDELNNRNVLNSIDFPYIYTSDEYKSQFNTNVSTQVQHSTGLFVMEKGPFLRGKMVDDNPIQMPDHMTKELRSTQVISHCEPRNLGDRLAFEALYAKMRIESLFDWSPDGMILSKLESPSGDVYSSTELDARQAQLFNVAVQGPALAKSWTGDPQLHTMPMDKVFVVMVADVISIIKDPLSGADASGASAPDASGASAPDASGAPAPDASGAPAPDASGSEGDAIKTLQTIEANLKSGDKSKVQNAEETISGYYANFDDTNWKELAIQVKEGNKPVIHSIMTNFSLKRVTSSYLAQYSHYRKDDTNSRCHLRIGAKEEGNITIVAAEYIIGGWCVGTVMDNAASRSTISQQVRTAPATMALNINVDVEWWSGDKLYRHYMDVDGTVFPRDVRHKIDSDEARKRNYGEDVEEVNRREENKTAAAEA